MLFHAGEVDLGSAILAQPPGLEREESDGRGATAAPVFGNLGGQQLP